MNIRRIVMLIVAVGLLACAACAANAWTVDQVDFSGSAGTGTNTSYLVVDFDNASYAFQYHWDGDKTGFDMIQAVANEVPGFSMQYGTESYGHVVDVISYPYGANSHDCSDFPNWGIDSWGVDYFWYYTTSSDGQTFDGYNDGVDGTSLTDGMWNGFHWTTDYTSAPVVPLVPEPSSLFALTSLIGLATSAKLLRFRGK